MKPNRPLTRAEVQDLPGEKGHWEDVIDKKTGRKKGIKWVVDFDGFSPTSNGMTNRVRRMIKQGGPSNNSKRTPGRIKQRVEIKVKRETKFGTVLERTGKYKNITHTPRPSYVTPAERALMKQMEENKKEKESKRA